MIHKAFQTFPLQSEHIRRLIMNWRSLVATLPKSRYVNAGSQEVEDSSRVKLLN